jgi:phosphoribosylanthranilate isomerase
MIGSTKLKVCGLRRAEDAAAAAAIGADWLGFIFYPPSPRYVSPEQWSELASALPPLPRVAVLVAPSPEELASVMQLGFAAAQVHFPQDTPAAQVVGWSRQIGRERLWLAPQLPPGAPFDYAWLGLASGILWDAYRPGGFGGTGQASDWERYRALRQTHPESEWILAGGLGPDTVLDAIAATGASFVDVNSAVESEPGVKDAAKLMRLQQVLSGGNP